MTLTTPTTAAPDSTRATRRHAGVWVAMAVVLVAVGVVGAILAGLGNVNQRALMDPDSAAPDGTRALTQILRERGVQVTVARDRSALEAALKAAGRTATDPATATLVVPDSPLLTDETLQTLAQAADRVVIAQPQARAARLLFQTTPSGYGGAEALAPGCAVPAAVRAGAVAPGTLFDTAAGSRTDACYRDGAAAGLLQHSGPRTTVSLVDGTVLFTNSTLTQDGNAALAVNLLGARSALVWYVPSPTDATGATPTLGELTPGWVTPVIVLLVAAAVAAAFWRGRRFGPLVAETLPVTVRGGETTDGRARLYARSHDLVHTADRLRIGLLRRAGRMLRLGPGAGVAQICDGVADRLGMPRERVHRILLDDLPRTERELLALSDSLRDLERALQAALRTSPHTPNPRTPHAQTPHTDSPHPDGRNSL